MILAFEKHCACAELEASYPKPSISTRSPRPSDPFAYVEISFACPICASPWLEIIADNFGEKSGPKIGARIVISDEVAAAQSHPRLLKRHA